MSRAWTYSLAVTALVAGLATRHWLTAAPAHVFGSPNLPVETYRNQQGTFVLWSDGRITLAGGDATDLGHPYSGPPPAAQVAAPQYQAHHLRPASPNVAVAALTAPEGTLILFSDGSLKKPNRANAAAPGESTSSTVIGGWGWTTSSDYQADATGSTLTVQLESPPAAGSVGWAIGFNGGTPCLYGQPNFSGNSVTFNQNPISAGADMVQGFFVISGP